MEHLFLGTHAENSADAAEKMRTTLGSRNAAAKLDENTVTHIKCGLEYGFPIKMLAAKYGVSAATIYSIKSGKTWGWLDMDPVTRRT